MIFVPLWTALLLLPVLYMPLFSRCVMVCYAYHRKTERGKAVLGDVFEGAVKGFGPAVVMGFFSFVIVLIQWSTWWYYGGNDGIGNLTIGGFQTYFVMMAVVSQFYTLQLVIQENMGIIKAMAYSVKLFLKYPAYTIGACFQAFCVAISLLLAVVGFGFLFNGMWSIFQHKVTYNALHPEEVQPVEDGAVASEARGIII